MTNKIHIACWMLVASMSWGADQEINTNIIFKANVRASTLTTGILHLDANGNFTSSAVDLSGAEAVGILGAARFPAITGDVTTPAGSLATTLTAQNSAFWAGKVTDETGSGLLVFGTSPTITGGIHTALTSFGLRSTGTGAFDLTLANTENLTANRTLTLKLNNAARTIDLAGNLTVSSAATLSGTNTGDQTITLTGDVTGSGTGSFAATIGAAAVTYAKIQNVSATDRLLGRKTVGAGSAEEITVGGDIIQSGSTFTIPAGTVTLAKMANLATATMIGRTTAGTGVPEALTVLPAALEPSHTGDVTNSAGSLALAIGTNKVTSAMIRQGIARSIIGVTGNATANVADIQGTADQVLRVTTAGTGLGFGTVANAGLTNSSLTVTAGTGLSGGGAISLGGSASLAVAATIPQAESIVLTDAVTATAPAVLTIGHNTSGTPAASYGSATIWNLQSSTTADTSAANLTTTWATATHASRKARSVLNVYDTAAREVLRGEASGTAPMIGFLGAGAVAAQTGDIGTAMMTFGLMTGTPTFAAASLSGTVPVVQGGTSSTTLTANAAILGNGTNAPTFVAPGVAGSVFLSNGTTWASNTDPTLTGAWTWDGSTTGISWTTRTSVVANNVTYGNGLFVAVGSNSVQTSPTGVTWTSRTSAANNNWNSVTYGNGLFVAVSTSGTGNRVMTSPDGITWTSRTSAANNSWNGVIYANSLFVAVSGTGTGNRVMTSPDGITWTSRTSAADNTWNSITYGNGLFVAVSSSGVGNRVMTSSDGITWTSRTSLADSSWFSVTYGNGYFVAVAINGSGVMRSPDGITWSAASSGVTAETWNGVTYGSGYYIAVANSNNKVMISTNTANWTVLDGASTNPWKNITYGDGLFVAVATSIITSDPIMTSPAMRYLVKRNLIGFFGAAGVVQPASANQASLTNNTGGTYDGTLVDVTTASLADPAKINANFTDIYTLLTELRSALVSLGLISGAAP